MEPEKKVTEPKNKVPQSRLIRRIIDNLDDGHTRFAFLLGAGASVSSRIPAAGELAKRWLEELEEDDPEAFKKLKSEVDKKGLAACYGEIFKKRFEHSMSDGYHAIEKIITAEEVEPSLGYLLLAGFLLETNNNIVITTNFDRLTETALLTVFNHHAKVISHESMLPIVKHNNKSPAIMKVHNDVFFKPKNRDRSISGLSLGWERKLNTVLSGYHLIVLGYGGNKREGLMQYIGEEMKPDDIYWCYMSSEDIPKTVHDREYHCVKIDGFDEFMVALNAGLPVGKIPKIDSIKTHIETMAKEKIKKIDGQLDKYYTVKLPLSSDKSSSNFDGQPKVSNRFRGNLEKIVVGTWWEVQSRIDGEMDNNKKNELYRKGLEGFPKSHQLRGNYANFLTNFRKNYDAANRHYKKALKIAPDDANINGKYANFLMDIRKDYDAAESYYKKALKIVPDNAPINENYANFLMKMRKDYNAAESYYKKALEIAPEHAVINRNYANFLRDIRKDCDAAEHHYKEALKIAPDDAFTNRSYAYFLTLIRKDYDAAEHHYKEALEIAPDNAEINGNYANFLRDIRKDYDAAEHHYKEALKIAPDDAESNGNYAHFLADIRKDYDAANRHFQKTLKIAPDDAFVNGNYALFLTKELKDYDAAESYFQKALKIAPDNADIHGTYANFLCFIRKNPDAAERHYQKALEIDPDNALIKRDYADFLKKFRKGE